MERHAARADDVPQKETFDRFEADFGGAAFLDAERRSGGSGLTSDKFANLLARNEAGTRRGAAGGAPRGTKRRERVAPRRRGRGPWRFFFHGAAS